MNFQQAGYGASCRKPLIRVEAGMFVGYIEDEQYVLGNIGNGIEPAVQKMIRLRMEHSSVCEDPPDEFLHGGAASLRIDAGPNYFVYDDQLVWVERRVGSSWDNIYRYSIAGGLTIEARHKTT